MDGLLTVLLTSHLNFSLLTSHLSPGGGEGQGEELKAVVITRPGGPEVLALRDVPAPSPGAGEILVRVRAAGINRADVLQRMGQYPPPPGAPADVPGL